MLYFASVVTNSITKQYSGLMCRLYRYNIPVYLIILDLKAPAVWI